MTRFNMRPLARSLAAAAIVAALTLPAAPAGADPVTTPADRVFVVEVNMGWNSQGGGDYKSESFFRRLAETGSTALTYKPDFVIANEVLNAPRDDDPDKWHDKYGFRNKLEEFVGGEWSWVHSDEKGQGVFFRSDRFELVGEKRQWHEKTGANCDEGAHGMNEVAGRFRSKVGKEGDVFVAAVHFDWHYQCVYENVKKTAEQMDAWSARPMTIVGGDFNEPKESATGDPQTWRIENDPSCWWKDFYGEDNPCRSDFGAHYYDAVNVARYNGGTGVNAPICAEWTKSNSYRSTNDNANQCNSDKRRTSFIWARWENSNGAAIDDPNASPGRIEGASADRGYWIDNDSSTEDIKVHRYSDHRAVRAVISF